METRDLWRGGQKQICFKAGENEQNFMINLAARIYKRLPLMCLLGICSLPELTALGSDTNPPVISLQPTNQTVTHGVRVNLGLTVSGEDLSYQWFWNGFPIGASNIITTVAGNISAGGSYSGDGGAAMAAGLSYTCGVAVDGAGNLFIDDSHDDVISKVDAQGIITTVAGNNSLGGTYAGDGGAATNAGLYFPNGIALDSRGDLYIADTLNNVVRKVDASGLITTVAGNNNLGAGYAGDGGPATNATLNSPAAVAVDGAGNLYIADYLNNVVRKVDASGLITTVAGNNGSGVGYAGDGGPATNAVFNSPAGVAVDGAGNLYIADPGNNVIRKVDDRGVITTVAGDTDLGGFYSGDGGAATSAALSNPQGVAVDGTGNFYIAETSNNVIREVNAAGIIATVAGDSSLGGGYSGDGGTATHAALNNPVGIAVDRFGDLYVADAHNNVIREVIQSSSVNITNGTLTIGNAQPGVSGSYQVVVSNPAGSVTSSVVSLVVYGPPLITTQPVSQTVNAGDDVLISVSAVGTPPVQYQWEVNGTSLQGATNATLSVPGILESQAGDYSVKVVTPAGNIASTKAVMVVIAPPVILVQGTNQIVTNGLNATLGVVATGPDLGYQWLYNGVPIMMSNVITTVAGNHSLGNSYSGDGGVATNAGMFYTCAVAVDGTGNLYVADSHNNVIRKVDVTGGITTVAGNHSLGGGYTGDGGAATNVGLYFPNGIAADGIGNLYIADTRNNLVRKVDTNGVLTTVAGNAGLGAGYSGDGGAATGAQLSLPNAVALDAGGDMYIADTGNNVIRKVDANGTITTVAGDASLAGVYSGESGPATTVSLNGPTSVSLDGLGNLYIADTGNDVIRKVNYGGYLTTVAGDARLGGGYSGDGGAATNAALFVPDGIVCDAAGNLYIAEYANNVIRKVDVNGTITTWAGTRGGGGYSGDGGAATSAVLMNPVGLAVDGWGNLFIGDADNSIVREVSSPGFLLNNASGALTITGTQLGMSGSYQVVVSNPAGSVTSSVVSLVVYEQPVILTQPASQAVYASQTVTFEVSAAGTPPVQYQWSRDGVSLNGATNAVLTLTNVQAGQAGDYAVEVITPAGDITSSNATLTVIAPPVFLTQPTSQTLTNGAPVTLGVLASGEGLSYQWLYNGLPYVEDDTISTVAGNVSAGGIYSGDGGAATNAGLYYGCGVAFDGAGNMYIADSHNDVIRRVDARGIITTYAGNNGLGGSYTGDGGAATNAGLAYPNAIAEDGAGNLYIADTYNNVIRKVDTNGQITTVAGNYTLGGGYSGDGGVATNAALNSPVAVAIDGAGNLYIADYGNDVIRKMDENGVISTVAGNVALEIHTLEAVGVATNVVLFRPQGVMVDRAGNLYISEGVNDIRKVDGNGIISTVAGIGLPRSPQFFWSDSGDGGPAMDAELNSPNGMVEDGAGNLYIAEYGFSDVRRVDTAGIITTVAGNPSQGAGYSGDGGPATSASLNGPVGLAMDGAGNLYIADTGNDVIRKVTFGLAESSTNGSLSAAHAQVSMSGTYQVIVSNPAGSITSSVVHLEVYAAPTISSQPVSQTVTAGGGVIFNVTAGGNPPVTYQWTLNGKKLAGATTASLTLTNIHAPQAGNYAVTVSNPLGSLTSSNATLTFIPLNILAYNVAGEENDIGGGASGAYGYSGQLIYLPSETNGVMISWGVVDGKKRYWTADFSGYSRYTLAGAGNQTFTVLEQEGQNLNANGNLSFWSAVYQGPNSPLAIASGKTYFFPAIFSGTLTDFYPGSISGDFVLDGCSSTFTFAAKSTQTANNTGQTVTDLVNAQIKVLASQGYTQSF